MPPAATPERRTDPQAPKKPIPSPRGSRKVMLPKEALQPSKNMAPKVALPPAIEQDQLSSSDDEVLVKAMMENKPEASRKDDSSSTESDELGDEERRTMSDQKQHAPSMSESTLTVAAQQRERTNGQNTPRITSMERYIGPRSRQTGGGLGGATHYETILQDAEQDEMPTRTRPEESIRDTPILDRDDIEYDPSAWVYVDGILRPGGDRALWKARSGLSTYKPLGPEVSSAQKRKRQGEVAAARRRKPPKQSYGDNDVDKIRIGYEFQVAPIEPPCTSSAETTAGSPDMIYDPKRADEARGRGEQIDAFLEQGREFNVTMMLMEALHISGYVVKEARKEFIKLHQSRPKPGVLFLTESEKEAFDEVCRELVSTKKKDFSAAAARMDCRVECVLVHYYKWKTGSDEYLRMRREYKAIPDECCVCDDGGDLIGCENCRKAYHKNCVRPPLKVTPEDDWYCPRCVQASPAKLRRQSSFRGDSPSSASPSSARRRLPMGAVSPKRKASLRSIYKELAAGDKPSVAAPHAGRKTWTAPSGMVWDEGLGYHVPINKDSPAQSALFEEPCGGGDTAAEDAEDASERSSDAEDDSISDNGGSKRIVLTVASSSDEDIKDDSTFNEDDADDDMSESSIALPANGAKQGQKLFLKDSASKKGSVSAMARPPTGPHAYVTYEARIPITREGLLICLRSSKRSHGAEFAEYRRVKSDVLGFAERMRVFRAVGDLVLEVDGFSCANLTFQEVMSRVRRHNVNQMFKVLKMQHDPNLANEQTPFVVLPLSPSRRPAALAQQQKQQRPPAPRAQQQQQQPPPAPRAQQQQQPPPPARVQQRQQNYNPLHHQMQAFPRSPSAPAPSLGTTLFPLANLLLMQKYPILLQFLGQRRIFTIDAFLSANSSLLAKEYAQVKAIDWNVALDFIGSVRLEVRRQLDPSL